MLVWGRSARPCCLPRRYNLPRTGMTDQRAQAMGAATNSPTEVTRAACMALKAEARQALGPKGRLYIATDGYRYSVPPRSLPWEVSSEEEQAESSDGEWAGDGEVAEEEEEGQRSSSWATPGRNGPRQARGAGGRDGGGWGTGGGRGSGGSRGSNATRGGRRR